MTSNAKPATTASTHEHGHLCRNCGADLTGEYCSACGQPAHLHNTVGGFFHDLLHGVLHFEGKLGNTMPLLFWKPGELTRRYIDGERRKFFSPLGLFLFAVFLTFIVYTLMGAGGILEVRLPSENQPIVSINAQEAPTTHTPAPGSTAQPATNASAPAAEHSAVASTSNSGIGFLDSMINKINADPHLAFYKLQSNGYKYAWALILLSAPFMWLLFPFSRKYGMFDHLVFVTYSLSFMLILMVTLRILSALYIPSAVLLTALIIIVPVHIFRQLRGAYEGSVAMMLLRTLALLAIGVFLLVVFVIALMALGALG